MKAVTGGDDRFVVRRIAISGVEQGLRGKAVKLVQSRWVQRGAAQATSWLLASVPTSRCEGKRLSTTIAMVGRVFHSGARQKRREWCEGEVGREGETKTKLKRSLCWGKVSSDESRDIRGSGGGCLAGEKGRAPLVLG